MMPCWSRRPLLSGPKVQQNHALTRPLTSSIFTDFYRDVRTFLGDFAPDGLDSRSLQTLWEWENRVLLGEYYIFNVLVVVVVVLVIPSSAISTSSTSSTSSTRSTGGP